MNRSDCNNYGVLKRSGWRLVVEARPARRGRGKRWRWPIAAFLFAGTVTGSIDAQPNQQHDTGSQAALFNESRGFLIEFQTTFFVEACGDEGLGMGYRKAVLAAIAACPLTETARMEFNEKTRAWEETYGQNLHLLRPNPKNSSRTCEHIMQSSIIENLRIRLAEYKSGNISALQVTAFTCELGAKGVFPRPEDARKRNR